MNIHSFAHSHVFFLISCIVLLFFASSSFAQSTCPTLFPGTNFKTDILSSVWQMGEDGYARYYPHQSVFLAWQANFSSVVTIPSRCFPINALASQVPYGINYPPGTLIKLIEGPDVYVVGEQNEIDRIRDADTAVHFWGGRWESRVRDVSGAFWTNYRISGRVIERSSEDAFLPKPQQDLLSNTEPPTLSGNITAVWAQDGGEKIIQTERRGTEQQAATHNSVWDGSSIHTFGAKNEVVSFALMLETEDRAATNIDVDFTELRGPNGYFLRGKEVRGDALFDWTDRDIELFFVRYLEIKGMSAFCCNISYDERHAPFAFRRPYDPVTGAAQGTWTDRPHHNALYPEIAVPIELEEPFTIQPNTSQMIWADMYIPKDAPAGIYRGDVVIRESGAQATTVPVVLEVKPFTLSDHPSSKTMMPIAIGDINARFFGERFPTDPTVLAAAEDIHNKYYQLARRHKVTLVDDDVHPEQDRPSDAWIPRLDGSLYTAAQGYKGPGVGIGHDLFVIGLYGSWRWRGEGETAMREHTDGWEEWFRAHFPQTERFVYLIDESSDFAQINMWAGWINANPGAGRYLRSMATIPVLKAIAHTPELDIIASTMYVAPKEATENAANQLITATDKAFYLYNGGRPGQGSFQMEDEGVSLRELPWGQYKKRIDRWFYWNATYYNNYQAGQGETDLFTQAHTFGGVSGFDPVKGETGWVYSNGDGVLLYPGTDRIFPGSSYATPGPIASLRLKHWRRGIQDVDYLSLAAQVDPVKTQQIVNRMVPKVLWEYGVDDPNDPTWKRTDISWSTDPDDWEEARRELAEIIESGY